MGSEDGGDGGGGGGGGGGGLSKLGITLTIIFGITLAALLAELIYVLWRRRVFHRRATTDGGNQLSGHSSPEYSTFSSKELLYFFCIRPQSHLDQNSVTSNSTTNGLNSDDQTEIEVIDFDLMKIQGMFGPPRFLFTIKEEEREDLEEVKKSEDINVIKRVSLEDCLMAAEEETVVSVEIDDTTPFSTPCASPLYFTPVGSPEVVKGRSTEEGQVSSMRLEV